MNERGSLLITGLWAMSILSIMCVSLIFDGAQQMTMINRQIEDHQTRLNFLSGLNWVAALIHNDSFPHEDSFQDDWYGVSEVDVTETESLHVQVTDEESKLNLNTATQRQLETFLKLYEEEVASLRGDRKTYARAILKARSKKRLESPEELILLADFDPSDLFNLGRYWTVYPDQGLININTASSLILRTLILAIPCDEAVKQILAGRLAEVCQLDGPFSPSVCSFLSREIQPVEFLEKLQLPKDSRVLGIVQEFLSKVTTDSDNFRLQMQIRGRTAEAVIRCPDGQLEPIILAWHEE